MVAFGEVGFGFSVVLVASLSVVIPWKLVCGVFWAAVVGINGVLLRWWFAVERKSMSGWVVGD